MNRLLFRIAIIVIAMPMMILFGCTEPTGKIKSEPRKVLEIATITTASPGAEEDDAFRQLPGMDSLVNEHGIRRKIIITRENVRCTDNPNGKPVGLALQFFYPYFVFGTNSSGGKTTHFLIGSTPRQESVLGWVNTGDGQSWDHRIAARIIRDPGRRLPPLNVYGDKESVIKVLKDGFGAAEPIARASFSGGVERAWMPWPIIDSDRIEIDGKVHEIYQIAFLGEVRSGTDFAETEAGKETVDTYSAAEIAQFKTGANMLDVSFVIDVTGSMQSYYDAVKKTVREITKNLKNMENQPSVGFSLTAYRDYEDSGFVTKHIPLTTDVSSFLKQMETIKASDGGDEHEAVYDGVYEALTKTVWRDRLSARILCLIGDRPAHEPGSRQNPNNYDVRKLVDKAKEYKVTIMAMAVGGKDACEDYRIRWQQFSDLAQGTGGICVELEDSSAVISRIKAVVNNEAGDIQQRTFIVQEIEKGKTKDEIIGRNGVSARSFTENMEFLGERGVDTGKLSTGPTFSTGWVIAAPGGIPILEREVYIARSELQLLIAELFSLCANLDSNLGDKVAGIGFAGRVGARSWYGSRDQGPLNIWLASKGIPAGAGLLKLTREEVDHMPEEARARLAENLYRFYIPTLSNYRNDDSIFAPIEDLYWGFIKEADLP